MLQKYTQHETLEEYWARKKPQTKPKPKKPQTLPLFIAKTQFSPNPILHQVHEHSTSGFFLKHKHTYERTFPM